MDQGPTRCWGVFEICSQDQAAADELAKWTSKSGFGKLLGFQVHTAALIWHGDTKYVICIPISLFQDRYLLQY